MHILFLLSDWQKKLRELMILSFSKGYKKIGPLLHRWSACKSVQYFWSQICVSKVTHTKMFIAALLVMEKNIKITRGPFTGEWLNCRVVILQNTREYSTSMTANKARAPLCVKLKKIVKQRTHH